MKETKNEGENKKTKITEIYGKEEKTRGNKEIR